MVAQKKRKKAIYRILIIILEILLVAVILYAAATSVVWLVRPILTLLFLHILHLLLFRILWRRRGEPWLKQHRLLYFWWRPYINHSLAWHRLKFGLSRYGIIPKSGIFLEKYILRLLALPPFIDLFNGPLFRLLLLPWYFDKDVKKSNHHQVEIRVILMITILVGFLILFHIAPHNDVSCLLIILFTTWRMIVMPMYNLATIFLQYYGIYNQPVSMVRVLIILMLGYLEIILCFSLLYLCTGWIGLSECENILNSPIDSFYFSVVTITTLGYGDFRPIDWKGRLLVSWEALLGILFVVLIFANFLQRTPRRFQAR